MKGLGFGFGQNGQDREVQHMAARDMMTIITVALLLPFLYMAHEVMIAGGQVEKVVKELQQKTIELTAANAEREELRQKLTQSEEALAAEKAARSEAESDNEEFRKRLLLAEDYALTFILEPENLTSGNYEYDLIIETPDGSLTREEQHLVSGNTDQMDFRGSGRNYAQGIQKFIQDPAIVPRYASLGAKVIPGPYRVWIQFRKGSGTDTLKISGKIAGKKPFLQKTLSLSERVMQPKELLVASIRLSESGEVFWIQK